MISTAIKRAFKKGRERQWNCLYFAIDIHDTMFKANYESGVVAKDAYRDTISALKALRARPDIKLIVYSCSHPHELEAFAKFMKDHHDFEFDYYNENPEVKTREHGLGNYDKKFYFDVMIEDKAGFEPQKDWYEVIHTLAFMPILK